MSTTPPTPPTTYFQKIRQILNNAAGSSHPSHDGQRRFWELPLDQFVALTIYGVKLVAAPGPNRGANSGLIKALKGEPPFDGSTFDRMPLARPPVAPSDIQFIQDWIDAGCKDDPLPTPAPRLTALGGGPAGPPPAPVILLRNANTQLTAMGALRVRKNIENLQPEELANFREAVRLLKELPDKDYRKYINQANIHRDYCDSAHGTNLFVTWHRAYLYQFELLLQEMIPGVTLPYWDWMKTRNIPKAYADQSIDGKANSLYDSTRQFGANFQLPTAGEVAQAQNAPTFAAYGGRAPQGAGRLENPPHNAVHRAVGGNMGQTTTAAQDPIFWAHHANVDRLWSEWQKTHPGADPPNPDEILAPWSMKVRDVLSTTVLGYEYVADASLFKNNKAAGLSFLSTGPAGLSVTLGRKDFVTAELQLRNVLHSKDTFELRVFLNQPDATADTPTEANNHYAGRLVFFGHGECIGGPGHCDPAMHEDEFDLRPPRLAPYDLSLDVTDCVRRLAESAKDIAIKFVAVGEERNAAANLVLDGISLILRD